MKIKYWMTREPVTIGPEASIAEASRVMKEHGFRRLPVMDKGRLVGLVTYRKILEAQPSSVSTLSVHEARYLAAKMKVSDVMRANPITVSPEDDALTAMMEGHKNSIGAYPVVDGGHLVGIVTATDLFNLVAHMLGARERTDFIYLAESSENLKDALYLSRIATLLAGHGISMMSFMSFPSKEIIDSSVVLLKVSPGRSQKAAEILAAAGYKMID